MKLLIDNMYLKAVLKVYSSDCRGGKCNSHKVTKKLLFLRWKSILKPKNETNQPTNKTSSEFMQ